MLPGSDLGHGMGKTKQRSLAVPGGGDVDAYR